MAPSQDRVHRYLCKDKTGAASGLTMAGQYSYNVTYRHADNSLLQCGGSCLQLCCEMLGLWLAFLV